MFLLGRNNVGKSCILRLFTELKRILVIQADPRNTADHVIDLAPAHWDSLANRRSLREPMRIRVQNDADEWEYEISPNGDVHTSNVNVRIKSHSFSSNNAIVSAAKIFDRVVYFGPIRSTSYSGYTNIYTAVAGSNLINAWAEWSTGDNVQQLQAAENLESEIRDLFGFRQFTLRVHKDKNELKVSYDDGIFKLTELGDGLSHFITVLANALVARPSYILIDEPENGMHPKMQALFVQVMAAKCSHGLIASSHSMALARSVADKIYYCRKTEESGLQILDHERAEIDSVVSELREMSFSQLIESGEQNLLLVEGRTDVKAYRQLLRIYGLSDRFIVVPLGGGEFLAGDASKYEEELREILALGMKSVTVAIDSEKQSESEPLSDTRRAFKSVCEGLGFEVYVTERRATENYVPQEAINETHGPHIKALGPFARFASGNGWKKSQTWKLFSKTSRAFLDGTDLGRFFSSKLTAKAGL